MKAVTPDVIVIRGAPGVGKSQAAKRLAARLGRCVRIEADAVRAMTVPVDWTDQAEHIESLSLTAELVAGFVARGRLPVIVVDTFSGDKLTGFLRELCDLRRGLDIRVFGLVATPEALRARVEGRPVEHFKDLRVCLKLNEDVVTYRQPEERLIDNSNLTPEETVDSIVAAAMNG